MKLGVIGVGNMANAILESVLENGVFLPSEVTLFDPYSGLTGKFENKGCMIAASVDELIYSSDSY